MILGSCEVILYLPGALTLKEKRQTIKSLKDRLRNKFNISVSETDHSSLWQKATLGIACVSNEKKNVHMVFDQIIRFLESEPAIKIIDYQIQI